MIERLSIGLFIVLAGAFFAIERVKENPFQSYEAYLEAQRGRDVTETLLISSRLADLVQKPNLLMPKDRLRLKFELANLYLEKGDISRARVLYSDLLVKLGDPPIVGTDAFGFDALDRAVLNLNLIEIQLKENEIRPAVDGLRALSEDFSSQVVNSFYAGKIFKRFDEMVLHLAEALLIIDPDEIDYANSLLSVQKFLDENRRVEASIKLKEALQKRLVNDDIFTTVYIDSTIDLARYHLQTNSVEKARVYIDEALTNLLEIYPRQSVELLPALALKGQIQNEQGEAKQTIERLEEVMDLIKLFGDPDMPGAIDVIQTLKVAYELEGKGRKRKRLEADFQWMTDMVPIARSNSKESQAMQLEKGDWTSLGLDRIYFWTKRETATGLDTFKLYSNAPKRRPREGKPATGVATLSSYAQEKSILQKIDLLSPAHDNSHVAEIRGVSAERHNTVIGRIKSNSLSHEDGVLIVVHDVAVSFKDSLRLSGYLKGRSGFSGSVISFDWAENEHLFGYAQDLERIKPSARTLSHLLYDLSHELPDQPLYILSMGAGAKVVMEALNATTDFTKRKASQSPIHGAKVHLIFWGPEVSRQEFLVQADQYKANEYLVTLYQLSHSRRLKIARLLNRPKPIGVAASGMVDEEGIETIRGYVPRFIDAIPRQKSDDAVLVYDLTRLLKGAYARDRCGLRPIYSTRVRYWLALEKNCSTIQLGPEQLDDIYYP